VGVKKQGKVLMRILLTNDAEKIAGGENYVLHLVEGLSQKGHEIIVAPLVNSELEITSRQKGFETYGIPYGAHGKEFKAVRTMVNLFRGRNIDIVHTNSNLDRTIAAAAGRIIGARNISTIHSCLSINRNVVHWFRNRYLIDHFTPVGHSTKKIMVETDNILPEKITVVHIGIPENRIKTSASGRRRIRTEFNIQDDEVVIGSLSRLVEFKGHKFLLAAFTELIRTNKPNLKLMIVGEGELKNKLIQLSKDNNINDKVIFTGARNDVSDILSAFDIFTQFSIDAGGETFPVAIIEALAAGLPVVGSRVGDIEYLIDYDKNGYLVEPENVAMFNESLLKLIEDDIARKEMGKASLKKFINEFTLDKMIDNMEDVYKKVITGT
jgi:glycosyltransferase involved in cell wall biosynthesis